MRGRLLGMFGVLAVAACGAADGAAAARTSQYSALNDKACRTIEEIEETGDWIGACPGVGGYTLEWSSSDLRDDLTIVAGQDRTDLQIPAIVARGAFDSLGERVEWRGPAGDKPDVLIVRVHVAIGEGKSDNGRLAVARLGSAPCIVAIVPVEAGQNERAREIADGKLPDCLKN